MKLLTKIKSLFVSEEVKEEFKPIKVEIKRKAKPCKEHKLAAPTIVDAVAMGLADGSTFFMKCKVCGWEIPVRHGKSS